MVMEMILHSVPDTHSSECKYIAADSDSDTGDVSDQTAHSALTVLTEAPHINTDLSPHTAFRIFCFEITQLLFLYSYRVY